MCSAFWPNTLVVHCRECRLDSASSSLRLVKNRMWCGSALSDSRSDLRKLSHDPIGKVPLLSRAVTECPLSGWAASAVHLANGINPLYFLEYHIQRSVYYFQYDLLGDEYGEFFPNRIGQGSAMAHPHTRLDSRRGPCERCKLQHFTILGLEYTQGLRRREQYSVASLGRFAKSGSYIVIISWKFENRYS